MREEEEEVWERTLKAEEAEPLEELGWQTREVEEGAELLRRASSRLVEEVVVLLNRALAEEHAEEPPGRYSLLLRYSTTVLVPVSVGLFEHLGEMGETLKMVEVEEDVLQEAWEHLGVSELALREAPALSSLNQRGMRHLDLRPYQPRRDFAVWVFRPRINRLSVEQMEYFR